MELFCPNGHLLCEFDVSTAGEIQAKEICAYTITITNKNEIHLLGCRHCNHDFEDPFEVKPKPSS
jgi:hypothetical protein